MAGICDTPIVSTVCDTVGEAGASLISAPFHWLASAMGAAASWMFQGVWDLFDSTTLVDLTKTAYVSVYNVMFGIAVFIMLAFFCLQLITGMIRRDHAALGRAGLGLAKSVLGSFVIITLTTTLLQVVDQLCIGIVHATGNTLTSMGAKIGVLVAGLATINIAAPGAGTIITIFLAFLALSAAALVWFTLLIRKALILVAIVLAPIALAGAPWDATKGWFHKWASFVLALIFSKLVIVIMFLVAVNQAEAPIDLGLSSVADPVAGIVLMFIAAFAPYMVYKFIAFAGFDINHVISAEQESKQAMNRPIPTLSRPHGGTVKKILDGGDGDRRGGGSTSPDNPTPPGPPSPPDGGSGPAPAASDGAATTGAGGAAEGGAGAADGSATASAAGPAGLATVAGAKLVTGAAEAGPTLGNAIGDTADGHASAASDAATPAPPPTHESSPSARS